MRKIKVVLIMFMCVMQLAGCQQEIESQIFESEEIQSEEVQSTVEDVIEELTTELTETEENAEGKLDIATINEYGAFEETLKDCIKENIILKEGTQIENIFWVDEAQKCLRVAIQYEEQPEELWFKHLEDYFFLCEGRRNRGSLCGLWNRH